MNGSQELHGSPVSPISIESGLLSGLLVRDNIRAFLGVPYAAPPVEDLRWRPPQRTPSWSGVRPATRFGASAVQFAPSAASWYFGGETEFSEDCLYLNIWTGPEQDAAVSRPVLVWFHFGAFQFGSGSNPAHDGAALAVEGVTVVTVNYRLGRFGFLTHAELSAESDHQASGNYGIMDQIAALEWVQRNIEAFGGDPGNVTIGGASAGGGSVHILRCSPLAKGLFCKAICESGPGVAPKVNGAGHLATFTTLGAGEKAGAELLVSLGVSSIAALRKMPAKEIMAAHLRRAEGPWMSDLSPYSTSLSVFDTGNPIVDGHVIPEAPVDAYLAGRVADIPILAGHVGNEASGMPHLSSLADYLAFVHETFREDAEEVIRLYPAITDSEAKTSSSQLLADQTFVWPTWTSARLQARNLQSSVWYYKFLRAPPIAMGSGSGTLGASGAFHCAAVPYAFGNLGVWKWDWADGDHALTSNMVSTWVRFLRTGDPNGGQDHLEFWPALDGNDNQALIWVWDCEPRLEAPGARLREISAFWDKYYERFGVRINVNC